ncbi:MAG: TrkH family potassium uptake protein [bacterium]|nr:TrkH family potassium uptake protein [bacterium]
MNLRQVARMLAGFAAFFTLAQIPPLVLAMQESAGDFATTAGFLVGMLAGGATSTLLWLAGRNASEQAFRREAIAVAGLSWFLASLLGAIPLWWSGVLPHPIDAVFEATSGLTTCGATVLGSGNNPLIEGTPASLLLWRAMMQWIGGLGIVLVFVALLPAMGGTGRSLIASETVGVASDSFQPRAIKKARMIGTFYVIATACCAILLALIGGFPWFDAICHSFTTLATGGYSTRSSLAEFDSLAGEFVIIVFMFVGAISFTTVVVQWRTPWKGLRTLVRSGEFRLFGLLILIVITAITLDLWYADVSFGSALRQAAFNGMSLMTSTGYSTADYQAWPTLALAVLFCCMLFGGCTGSTAGGMKQVRLLVVLRLCAYTIRHFVRPKSVERVKLDNVAMPAAVISDVLAVVLLWFLCLVAGALIAAMDPALNIVSAFAASTAMICSTGPSFTIVDPASVTTALEGGAATTLAGTANTGPFGGYAELRPWTKILFSVEMVLGRLELLTILALFTPSFWRR